MLLNPVNTNLLRKNGIATQRHMHFLMLYGGSAHTYIKAPFPNMH